MDSANATPLRFTIDKSRIFEMLGTDISQVEVSGISKHGLFAGGDYKWG